MRRINDGKAAGLCELKLGAAKGTESSVCYIIGTGVGGAICTRDDVFYGADGFAGEFHFMAYLNGQDEVVKCGRTVANMGLVNLYNASVPEDRQQQYGGEILDLYLQGDALAVPVVEKWFKMLGLHMLSVIVTLNPEVVCVGGGVSERDWFLPKLISVYEELCASHFAGQHFLTTRIVRCTFKNDANLIGAALRAVTDRFLSDAAVVSRTTLGETVRQAHSLRTQLHAR